jgi:SAM-dependent methyltransferase
MSASFHDHFSAIASRYADFRPSYPSALFDFLATLVPRTITVWDCACGSGQASVDLAERFERVIATDGSQDQIGSAAAHPRIDYRVALAEQSSLPDHSIGLLTVAQALHWFDLPLFYAEVKRVLAPGGVMAIWGYGFHTVEGESVNPIVQRYYSETVGPYWPPERKLIESGYRAISFPFAEITPPIFKMEVYWTLEQLLGYLSTWSATNRYIKATGRNPLPALAEDLKPFWGDADQPRQVAWTLPLRIGRQDQLRSHNKAADLTNPQPSPT